MLDGIPMPFFEMSGWGALGAFVILLGILVYRWFSRGTLITKGEHERVVQGYKDRIAQLIDIYNDRLGDKDKVIEDKDRTNRANQETMRTILDTLDGYGQHFNELAASQRVTEQVIVALNRATSEGGVDE